MRGLITFNHSGRLSFKTAEPDLGALKGVSPEVIRVIVRGITQDSRLARYRTKMESISDLSEALQVATTLMEAIYDPESMEIDSGCGAVGGHRHICTITPRDGFVWIEEPANSRVVD